MVIFNSYDEVKNYYAEKNNFKMVCGKKIYQGDDDDEDEWDNLYENDIADHYNQLILMNEELKTQLAQMIFNEDKKKPKKEKPPPPKEYWLNRRVEKEDGTIRWGWENEEVYKDYVKTIKCQSKMLDFVAKNRPQSLYSEEAREGLVKKPRKGATNKQKAERSQRANEACSLSDNMRCQHRAPVVGSNYKKFQRCTRHKKYEIFLDGETRWVCKTHFNHLEGLADNQRRPKSDFKSKNKEIQMSIKGSWFNGMSELIKYGGAGGWHDSPIEPTTRYQYIQGLRLDPDLEYGEKTDYEEFNLNDETYSRIIY